MKPLYFITLLFIFTSFHRNVRLQHRMTLDHIFKENNFREKTIHGLRSTSDGKHYTTLEGGKKIIKYSYETGNEVAVLFNALDSEIIQIIDDYELNENEDKLLIFVEKAFVYRYSFHAKCFIWDIRLQQLIPIAQKKVRMASFSPNGEKIAYVHRNNLYILDITLQKTTQVTFDGEYNKIINGIPDWVYEEEFGYNKAFEWLEKGRYLAFKKFNEADVKQFNMTVFSKESKSNELLFYPQNYTFKYPKAGEKNSKVTVHIYDIKKQLTYDFDLGDDIYIPRIISTQHPNRLLVLRLNRRQDRLDYIILEAETKKKTILYTEKEDKYIDESNFDYVKFIDSVNSFIFLSEKDGFNHIYRFDGNTQQLHSLTEGNWDVTDFYGYNSEEKTIYFQAAKKNPMQREVYRKHIDDQQIELLSNSDGYNKAIYSKKHKFFINFYSNINQPSVCVLKNSYGEIVRILEKNDTLKNRIDFFQFPKKKFITLTAADDKTLLNAWMLKPKDFDNNKSYPLLIIQYAGPNSQEVLDKWSFDWEYFLVQEGYIVVGVDPRGTGGRGEKFRKDTYLQLGKLEVTDLIAVARQLSNNAYIDEARIGIWGWSYGGFIASSCLFKSNVFKTAIAVAPVTSWRLYDNIYTERFMRKPQENPNGYDDNSPINMVDDFKSGQLLIVHGTADDNVHLQNTLELAEKLVQANKQFNMHIYKDKNHSIKGNGTRLHLYTLFFNFLERHLK